MDSDLRRYRPLENTLIKINGNIISLSKEDRKRNNEILTSIVSKITDKMKEKDALFNEMFERVFYGGSSYDGLKVSNPDEYDLDLLMQLPRELKFKLAEASNLPGYVHLKILDHKPSLQKLDLNGKHKGIDKMINSNHFLVTSEVQKWMEKVVQLAMNTFGKDAKGRYILPTPHGNFYTKIHKSFPAFTLKATGTVKGKTVDMDVDLVPCFVFDAVHWPKGNFRSNPIASKPKFFIVPKTIKGMKNSEHYWRLSFQEQERALIGGHYNLKPTIKLLKKMRDVCLHKAIASYYIKTVVLWMAEEESASFWTKPLSHVFMTALKKYQTHLESGKIPYYWNKHHNLIKHINKITLDNINNRIKTIIADIDRDPENPLLVAKYLGSAEELLIVRFKDAHI